MSLKESRCPKCEEYVWQCVKSNQYFDRDTESLHVCKSVPPSSNAPDPESANRASELGAMGVPNEAARIFDGEL